MKILRNMDNDDLYCVHCKSRIEIGEKYILMTETCYNETVDKAYHWDCFDLLDNEDEDGLVINE